VDRKVPEFAALMDEAETDVLALPVVTMTPSLLHHATGHDRAASRGSLTAPFA
jgi:hypothetical protein